jgi:hypothetical protein
MGESDFKNVTGLFLCIGVSTTPGGDRIHPNVVFCVLKREASLDGVEGPFLIIGTEARTPAIGCSAKEVVMVTTLPLVRAFV